MWQRGEITGYQIGTFPGAEVYLCPECAKAYAEEKTKDQSELEDYVEEKTKYQSELEYLVEHYLAFPIRSEDIWNKPLKCQRCGKGIKVVLNRKGLELFIWQCPTLEEARAQYGAVGVYWFHDAMKDPDLWRLARKIEEERRKLEEEERRKLAEERISDIRKAIKRLLMAKYMLLKEDDV